MSDISIDVSELKTLARDLRRASPELAKNFLTSVGKAGEVVAQQAKLYAAFSDRIPKTIRVRRRGVNVRVQAGGDQAPDAAPFENKGQLGVFRHPVFGNRAVWVNQQARPFLTPAAEDTLPLFEAEVISAVDKTFLEVGFRG